MTALPDSVARQLRDLERRVRDLERGDRLPSASFRFPGTLRYLDGDGNQMFWFGGIVDAADGSPLGEGVLWYRPDGSLAFAFYDPSEGVNGHITVFYDQAGNGLLVEDAVSGQGLAKPYLPAPFRPANDERTTASGVFEPLWLCDYCKQHPKVRVAFVARADAGTTGEVRLWDTVASAQIGDTVVIPDGGFFVAVIGPAAIAGDHLEIRTIQLEARVTSGAGEVGVTWRSAFGWQS